MKKLKFRKNTGITLIALVVTIIVLLILAGITLSLALNNNGIFQRSKNAAAAYSEAEKAEREELDRIAGEMDEVMGIFPPLEIPEDLEEGAEITYKPEGTFHWDANLASSYENDGSREDYLASYLGLPETTSDYDVVDMQLATGDEENFQDDVQNMNIEKWRVVRLNKETGEAVIAPKSSTLNQEKASGYVCLQGAQGYNNAVKLLNDACESLYGNQKKGITARSIRMEDIEPLLEEEALEAAKNNITPSYGNRYTDAYEGYRDSEGNYIKCKKFPTIYAQEKNSIVNGILNSTGLERSKQNSYISRTGSIKVGTNTHTATNGVLELTSIRPDQTYYEMNYNTFKTALGENDNIYLPQNEETHYWVASRCVTLFNGRCYFNVNYVGGGSLAYFYMYGSGGDAYNNFYAGLFPIVTLKSGVISGNATDGYTFTTN